MTAGDSPGAAGDPVRRALVERFEQWLDRTLAPEAPPEGVAAELLAEVQQDRADAGSPPDERSPGSRGRLPDLFDLHAGLTALTHEIKLQGRAFKSLADGLQARHEPVEALRDEIRQTMQELQERTRTPSRSDGPPAGDLVEALLDVRDRLTRGLAAARSARAAVPHGETGWFDRLLGRDHGRIVQLEESCDSLVNGSRITLEALDDSLGRLGIQEIPCVGRPFDPHCMRAVDTLAREEAPAGTVVSVQRPGYTLGGEVHRPALVVVAAGAKGAADRVDGPVEGTDRKESAR